MKSSSLNNSKNTKILPITNDIESESRVHTETKSANLKESSQKKLINEFDELNN